jgi:hypothetical protein
VEELGVDLVDGAGHVVFDLDEEVAQHGAGSGECAVGAAQRDSRGVVVASQRPLRHMEHGVDEIAGVVGARLTRQRFDDGRGRRSATFRGLDLDDARRHDRLVAGDLDVGVQGHGDDRIVAAIELRSRALVRAQVESGKQRTLDDGGRDASTERAGREIGRDPRGCCAPR